MPETLTETSTEPGAATPVEPPIEALPVTPAEPPKPGKPFEGTPQGTSTSNETSTQDSGTGG